jgi:DNA polymerase-3 subunit delta
MADRITLALGSDAALVQRAVLAVSAAARKEDPEIQRSTIAAGDEAAAHRLREAAAPNLFGEGAVLVVDGVDGADDAMGAAIREVLADRPEGVYLVFTHPGGMKGKGLLDAIKAAGADVVDCAPLKGPKKAGEFVAKEFASRRRKVTPAAITALQESVGSDAGLLGAAVSQLCADVEANPIDDVHVAEYFAGVAGVSGFTIADAIWERDSATALRTLRQAMLGSDANRMGAVTVAAIANGLRSLVRFGGTAPGASDIDIAKEAGVPPFKVKALRKQWARWSGDQRRLAAAVVALADADADMKGGVREGTALDSEQKLLALELLVAATSGHRAPSDRG